MFKLKSFLILFLFCSLQLFSQQNIENYDNGTKKLVENYKNGMLHGEVVFYFPNGKTSKQCYYYEGKEDGE